MIENDFHDGKDLAPNVCAVFTEEGHRGRGIAGHLLHLAVEDMRAKGISPIYLITDHAGFYDTHGREFLCLVHVHGASGMTTPPVHRSTAGDL